MSIIRFFRDVICAPYSIPIGIINYNVKTLGMCSETSKKELDIRESTDHSVSYSGSVGHSGEDITSKSDYLVLNQAIQNILTDASNRETRTVSTNSKITINCPNVLSLEEDPFAVYTKELERFSEKKIGNDGRLYDVQTFRCCPDARQTNNITVITFETITEEHYESIYNELELYIENTLTETGSDTPSSMDMSVLSGMYIKTFLKQQIQSLIENKTNQNVNVNLTMDYTDRYGRCAYDYDENGYLIVEETWCGRQCGEQVEHFKCCGKSKILKQTVDIEILTKNIIETSMKLVMENRNRIDSKTSVTVNRIMNYRVIVVSLLLNIIIIFILFKFFGMFLQRIN
jgi:hypothetical protein